ncbi:hypothetical protein D3C81_2226490 [compost metagenome]
MLTTFALSVFISVLPTLMETLPSNCIVVFVIDFEVSDSIFNGVSIPFVFSAFAPDIDAKAETKQIVNILPMCIFSS